MFSIEPFLILLGINIVCESGVEDGKKPDFHLIFLTKQRRDAMIASDLNFPNDCI